MSPTMDIMTSCENDIGGILGAAYREKTFWAKCVIKWQTLGENNFSLPTAVRAVEYISNAFSPNPGLSDADIGFLH